MFLGSSTKLSEWLHKTYTVKLTREVDYIRVDAFSFLVAYIQQTSGQLCIGDPIQKKL